jgi:squalene-associated FAD-dependent desaturase
LSAPARPTLAVVGGGWAGLAAAVRATEAGTQVTLFEMAARPGGRAREVRHDGVPLDNGQHILIGAYRETLALMRSVGADPDALLQREPLALVDPAGCGLRLPPGPALPAFVRGVLRARHWPWRSRVALLRTALRWRLQGFRAPPHATVRELIRPLPRDVQTGLIEPLCVAALNTPAGQASASVFLRVLRDALFGGPGAADLLLPRVSLSALLPEPAARWLEAKGATVRCAHRVHSIERRSGTPGWQVDGQPFDSVVLACSANEAARLTATIAPAWSGTAAAFDYEPIVTVYLASPGSRLPQPMTALQESPSHPAQFVFDLGSLDRGGARDGLFAFVVSGAREWLERGLDATTEAALHQAREAFDARTWREPPRLVRAIAERRATFSCTPGLSRPAAQIAPGLVAAGDYVQGPYPATLEGAVRSGIEASSLSTLGAR